MDLSSKVTLVYSFFAPILAVTAGAFTNAYISSVILLDYFKTKMMSSSNKILLALSLSNGCILALLIFGISSTAWITTCLCVFYFVKIINFSSGLFAWFKLKIDIIVPWLILVSEVVSLGCSFLTLLPSVNIQEPSSNSSMFYSLNSTSGATGISADFIKVTFITVCVPLLIMIVTTFPTIRTLYLHSRRMKNTGTSSSLAPHQSAVFMMAWLLFLYTVFFVVLFTGFIQSFTPPSFAYWMTYNLIYVATLVQSVVLILGNPKLKEAITICCCFVCHKSW
ncbi:hypothetical protein XENTR_v10023614 [Xenopus tropicalis]|nr:hypothetical protein XENTR_v10023614 [Xenopus tropicalis]